MQVSVCLVNNEGSSSNDGEAYDMSMPYLEMQLRLLIRSSASPGKAAHDKAPTRKRKRPKRPKRFILFADDSSSDGHGENAAEMEASDESGNEENGDAAQSDAWKKMKAKLLSEARHPPSARTHFCGRCGCHAVSKAGVFKHANWNDDLRAAHPHFSSDDAIFLRSVSQFYHYVRNLSADVLHRKASDFLRDIRRHQAKNNFQSSVPEVIQTSKAWTDLQAEMIIGRAKSSTQLHYCKICGYYGSCRSHMGNHARGAAASATHQGYEDSDSVCIEHVGTYYLHIKQLDCTHLHAKAEAFLEKVKLAEAMSTQGTIVPSSVRASYGWRKLQKEIEDEKDTSISRKLHYCSICGYIGSPKPSVQSHVHLPWNAATHAHFQRKDIVLLDDIEEYYHQIQQIDKSLLHTRVPNLLAIEAPPERKQKKADAQRERRRTLEGNLSSEADDGDHVKTSNPHAAPSIRVVSRVPTIVSCLRPMSVGFLPLLILVDMIGRSSPK
jgi:hypothetical protein